MTLLSPLWLFISGLLLVAAWRARRLDTEDSWSKVMDPKVLHYLRPSSLTQQSLLLAFFIAAVIALALTAPATEVNTDESTTANAETWWALVDVSRSMQQNDIVPDRMDGAKRYLMQLRETAGARPLGLIVFAGDAFLASPPTFDRQTFDDFVRALDTTIIDIQGSRPHRALGLVQSILGESGSGYSHIWLISDSGGIDALSLQIARQLAADKHTVDVVLTALEGSQQPEPVRLSHAKELAQAGRGKLTRLDALGEPDMAPDTTLSEAHQQALTLRLGGYKLWSHWLILLLLPWMLILMRRWRA